VRTERRQNRVSRAFLRKKSQRKNIEGRLHEKKEDLAGLRKPFKKSDCPPSSRTSVNKLSSKTAFTKEVGEEKETRRKLGKKKAWKRAVLGARQRDTICCVNL